MSKRIGNIELFMGPAGDVGGPDDLQQTIIDFIDGATKSLYVAIQELDNREIAQALIRARNRRVVVRIVLEEDYLINKSRSGTPFQPGGGLEPNREIFNALLRSNIRVHVDFNPEIFHQKFIIRDKRSILAGSTNFTDTGVTKNLNHIVIIHDDPARRSAYNIVKDYIKEFDEIANGRFGAQSDVNWQPPDPEDVGGIEVKALFAPDHGPEMEIMKQMLKATRTIDFAIFTFSESSGIDDTMVALANAGISITGVFDGKQASQKWAATKVMNSPKLNPIGRSNIDFRIVPQKGPVGKLHHKLMVIDRRVVIAGSFNYTGPANYINDENIIVIGDLEATDPAAINRQEGFAHYAVSEILRIRNTFGKVII